MFDSLVVNGHDMLLYLLVVIGIFIDNRLMVFLQPKVWDKLESFLVILTSYQCALVCPSYLLCRHIAPEDYMNISTAVSTIGGFFKPFFVVTNMNDQVDVNRTFNITLSNPSPGLVIGEGNVAVITIFKPDRECSNVIMLYCSDIMCSRIF